METSRDKIDEVLSRTDIAALIGQYVTLKPSGKDLKGLCPFHVEKTPSFIVHPDRGFFKCFGCGEGGGPIQFLMKIENISFGEALKILADRAGVTLTTTSRERKALTEKNILMKVMAAAASYYHEILTRSPIGKKGLAYLKQRGLCDKIIKDYQLGYAPAGGDFLIRHLRGINLSYELMEKAGVARRGDKEYYDYFRDRIIFPICDSQGRVIAMGGRGLSPDSVPKYLNTPESPIFSKRLVLYGLSLAKSAIRKEEQVYVVEGYMDAIALRQAGFENVVASMGTSLSEEQARAISRYTRRVIFAYDADTAGACATVRGIEIFEKAGLYVKIMDIPAGEDPDSILRKKGADFMRELTANARGIIEYKIDNLIGRFDLKSPEGKQEFVKELAPILNEIRGEIRFSEYIRIISQRYGIGEESLRRYLANIRSKKKIPDESPIFTKKMKLTEELVLNSLLTHPELIPVCREFKIDERCMRPDLYRIYRALIYADIQTTDPLSVDILSKILETEEDLKIAIDLSMKEGAYSCNEEQIRMLLKQLEYKKVREDREKSFQEKLDSGELTYEDPEYLEYIASLQSLKMRPR